MAKKRTVRTVYQVKFNKVKDFLGELARASEKAKLTPKGHHAKLMQRIEECPDIEIQNMLKSVSDYSFGPGMSKGEYGMLLLGYMLGAAVGLASEDEYFKTTQYQFHTWTLDKPPESQLKKLYRQLQLKRVDREVGDGPPKTLKKSGGSS